MLFVRVLEAGVWGRAPIHANADFEKTLVMARVASLWSVNHRPVEVFPGLIVSFLEPEAAQFFKGAGAGALPFVEKGELVAFACDDDANYYVSQGLAERLSEEAAKPLLEAAQNQLAEKRDAMLKQRLENKTLITSAPPTPATAPGKKVAPAPVTKAAAAAPKAAAKSGS